MIPLSIDIRSLRHVVELYKHRSFRLAADVLCISQPALSKSIKNIESLLNVNLFVRAKNGVEPTEYCTVVVEHARKIFIELEQVSVKLEHVSGLQLGEIIIGCGPYVAHNFLASVLVEFSQRHPHVRVQVVIENPSALSKMLYDGDIKFFLADAEDFRVKPGFQVELLPESGGVFFCRKGHPLAEKGVIVPADFLQYPFASAILPPRAVQWFRNNCPAGMDIDDFCRRALRLGVDSQAIILQIVRQTDYVTVVPENSLLHQDVPEYFVRLELQGSSVFSKFAPGIVTLDSLPLPPIYQQFLHSFKIHYQQTLQ